MITNLMGKGSLKQNMKCEHKLSSSHLLIQELPELGRSEEYLEGLITWTRSKRYGLGRRFE